MEAKDDKYKDINFDIHSDDDIRPDLLESIPFEYAGSLTEVTYETDEFTSVCPWTGLPDFATLIIKYVPDRELVELKSLKYYLTTYRNVGILQETAVNRILNDLVDLLKPVSMAVEGYFKERGGIRTDAVARYERDND
ncbi:MAG: NADPH-dependent 7-cyano-7-deazaguanine reductase QueF [Chloroflexi bacterium]|nr:NADPH-dependent 7-cyano-7-deazaguanine reductase QueF [Chloroflexota bacterium]MBT7080659.1 NADPH-dependent 7-cyano-7-deazaguanine reductase QueF [Chloroflexota bacterium]MBT7289934.1 NADPH-dependent 7-cyano-7-deazaguanine reductase QueF [Chloroflexota bacterium]